MNHYSFEPALGMAFGDQDAENAKTAQIWLNICEKRDKMMQIGYTNRKNEKNTQNFRENWV